MERERLFEHGIELTEQGKHREAVALFLTLANDTNNALDKAGLLLNASHAFKELRQIDGKTASEVCQGTARTSNRQ